MPPSTVKELKKYKANQSKSKLQLGDAYIDKGLVCCKDNGAPIHSGTFSHKFNELLTDNDLPEIRFHDLRHSHASLLVMQGVQPKIISERLGHSIIGITIDLYSHVFQNSDKEVAAMFDSIIKSKKKSG